MLLENNVRFGPASVMGNRQVKGSDTGELQYSDIDNYYRTSKCPCLPTGNYVGIEVTERNND